MKKNIGRSAVATLLLALTIAAISLPVHAQSVNWRLDRSAYAPSDSGTLTITVINTDGRNTLEIRNFTVYYPWASYDTNGKWLPGGNISFNLSPFKVLTTANGGGNNYSYTTPSFTIPSWWGAASGQQYGCPGGGTDVRYGTYSACILVGTNSNGLSYITTHFSVTMAIATYTPTSLSVLNTWVPLATMVVLIIATAFLAMAWGRLGNLPKKS